MYFYFVNFPAVGFMQYRTYAIDGTRPMTVNPIPKTSNGVKLRLNSVCCLSCVLGASEREVGRPCLYPRLANSPSSWPSATPGSGLDETISIWALILSREKMVITRERFTVRALRTGQEA